MERWHNPVKHVAILSTFYTDCVMYILPQVAVPKLAIGLPTDLSRAPLPALPHSRDEPRSLGRSLPAHQQVTRIKFFSNERRPIALVSRRHGLVGGVQTVV
eukprot:1178026-Prorocentrum_minimum.AAC.1